MTPIYFRSRAGELLNQIEPATGSHWESKREGSRPFTRTDAARDAGFSDHQKKQATRDGYTD